MKKSFSGFYNPTNEELRKAWLDKNTVFIFDTSVLLDIYSYKEITREDFFSSLEKLKSNIWIPFHVGLEYQRNRLEIISKAKAVFRHAKEELNSIKSLETKEKIKSITDMFPSLLEKTNKLSKDIDKLISDYENALNELNDKQPCVRSHDKIREKLNDLFCDKVGVEPNQDKIDAIEKDGEERYKDNIPPGFCDESNKKDEFFYYGGVKYKKKYGDLIIWKQIIEYVESNKNINNVIFITNDLKRDWWFIIDSGGNKRVGPHALLINEIKKLENVKVFDMYTSADFLENTSKYYSDFNVSEESINNVKDLERGNQSHTNRGLLSEWEKFASSKLDGLNKLAKLNKLDELNKLAELNKIVNLQANSKIVDIDEKIKTSIERIDKINQRNKFRNEMFNKLMNLNEANLKLDMITKMVMSDVVDEGPLRGYAYNQENISRNIDPLPDEELPDEEFSDEE